MPRRRHAIRAEDLGVQYDLRFTKKTTIRRSLGQMLGRGADEAVLGAPPRRRCGSPTGNRSPSSARTAPARARCSRSWPGSSGRRRASVDVRGHVSGLLTLGAGFDVELSGRDNILLGGAFLGLDDHGDARAAAVDHRVRRLGQFIDAPLKTYSSGMRARLGFAIATSVDPDILLLDEVLATGDATFREKSKARVIEIVRAAKAVVLVTHDMNWVTEYCNRAILIESGAVIMEGEPADVVELHRVHTEEARAAKMAAAKAAGLDPTIASRADGRGSADPGRSAPG